MGEVESGNSRTTSMKEIDADRTLCHDRKEPDPSSVSNDKYAG
jgi:hypothetical protein